MIVYGIRSLIIFNHIPNTGLEGYAVFFANEAFASIPLQIAAKFKKPYHPEIPLPNTPTTCQFNFYWFLRYKAFENLYDS